MAVIEFWKTINFYYLLFILIGNCYSEKLNGYALIHVTIRFLFFSPFQKPAKTFEETANDKAGS
jgi:hypothetical protein